MSQITPILEKNQLYILNILEQFLHKNEQSKNQQNGKRPLPLFQKLPLLFSGFVMRWYCRNSAPARCRSFHLHVCFKCLLTLPRLLYDVIIGTPTLFVNGRIVAVRTLAGFKALINEELNSGVSAFPAATRLSSSTLSGST